MEAEGSRRHEGPIMVHNARLPQRAFHATNQLQNLQLPYFPPHPTSGSLRNLLMRLLRLWRDSGSRRTEARIARNILRPPLH
jgi:hypothetical protein